MIYQFECQFECDEIKDCFGCPMIDGEYGNCNITGKDGDNDAIPADCPLVAISKTETTSCKWCEGGINTASLMGADMMMRFVRQVNYCPNCGRRLEKTI